MRRDGSASTVVPAEVLLLASVFVIAACGLVYELAAGALASYLLGDSVLQFSTVIGSYLAAMGLGLGAYVDDSSNPALGGVPWPAGVVQRALEAGTGPPRPQAGTGPPRPQAGGPQQGEQTDDGQQRRHDRLDRVDVLGR